MNKKEWAILISVFALDMATKFFIDTKMVLGQSIPVIRNFFYITYAKNTGAAWSMLEGKMIFFYILTTIACCALIYMIIKSDKRATFTRISLVMILAGALGNFADRIMFQYVRDFLDFIIFGYDFPIFNVADMSLCLGVALMFLIVFTGKEEFDGRN